jgi:D-alanyl-D-alanine carboxypeptidase
MAQSHAVDPTPDSVFIPKLTNPTPAAEAGRRACTKQYGTVALYGCRPKTHAVIDIETGALVLGQDADRRIQQASLNKVMTSLVVFDALRDGRVQAEQTIPLSKNAYPKDKMTQGWIRIGQPGQRIRVETALQLLTIRSANDAAVALAEAVAGSESAFVEKMNQKAREIGMKNTRFANASGWEHRDQYSTARDLALMMAYVARFYPDHQHYLSATQATYQGRTYLSHNNMMAGVTHRGRTGFDEVSMAKTGFFNNAGHQGLVMAVIAGRRYAIATTGHHYADSRHTHLGRLLDVLHLHAHALAPAQGGRAVAQPAPDRP